MRRNAFANLKDSSSEDLPGGSINLSVQSSSIGHLQSTSKLLSRSKLLENGQSISDIESRLMGLPGSLQLDNSTTNKYFGDKAKEEFFSRYQWLSRQRSITIKNSGENMDKVYFERDKIATDGDIPFAPIRPPATLDIPLPISDKKGTALEPSPKSFSDRLNRLLNAKEKNPQSTESANLDLNEFSQLSLHTASVSSTDVNNELLDVDLTLRKNRQLVEASKPPSPSRPAPSAQVGIEDDEEAHDEYFQTMRRIIDENGMKDRFFRRGAKIEHKTTSKIEPDVESEDSDVPLDDEPAPTIRKRATLHADMTKVFDFMSHLQTAKTQRAQRLTNVEKKTAAPSEEQKEEREEEYPNLSAFDRGKRYHVQAIQQLKKRKEEFIAARRADRPKSAPLYRSHTLLMGQTAHSQPQPQSHTETEMRVQFAQSHVLTSQSVEVDGSLPAPQSRPTMTPGRRRTQTQLEKPVSFNDLVKADEVNELATLSLEDSSYLDGSIATESTISTTALLWTNSGYKTMGSLRIKDRIPQPVEECEEKTKLGHDDLDKDVFHAFPTNASPSTPKQGQGLGGQRVNFSSSHLSPNSTSASVASGHSRTPLNSNHAKNDKFKKSLSLRSMITTDESGQFSESKDDNEGGESPLSRTQSNLHLISRELRSTADPKQRRENIMKVLHDKMKVPSVEEDLSRGEVASPRTKFLVGCIEQNLNPRAAMVLRKNLTKRLDLQHHGIGDQMARLLAESLKGLPFIQAINIADNRLTDEGMGPILQAAVHIPGLLELNLSQNVIGPVSAACMFEYLISPTCPLERLILRTADVDDFECENFVKAIRENRSLTELDLSSNLIGKAENLNTVMPELTTGAEALADLLRMPECRIKTLRLDWNMIRLDGGIDLANSISNNKTLTFLDLSYNSLATGGGITLGVSLLSNTNLETLILQNNAIDSVACIAICAGIIENRGLKRFVLDGNPIGDQGMRAVMLVPLLAGNRVKISAARCNISIKDANCWFNFDKLARSYELDMTDGFSRAVAIVLLYLIAGHPTYIFSSVEHEENKKRVALELVQDISTEAEQYFDSSQMERIRFFRKVQIITSDIRKLIDAFHSADFKGEGWLEKESVGDLLDGLGVRLTDQRLEDLFNEFDTDGNGNIDLKEYILMVKALRQEAEKRCSDLSDIPIMALKGERGKRFIPPTSGSLHITVIDGFARKALYRVMTSCDHSYVTEAVEGAGGDAVQMVVATLSMVKIRIDEALVIVDSMLVDNPDKVSVLKKVVLSINDFRDAYKLIYLTLGKNLTLHLRLKKELGPCYRVIMGNLNGFYVLDLALQVDRLCVERLIELSATFGYQRQTVSKIAFGRVGDLSQKGNWSCFRNEIYEGKPIVLNGSFLSPMPGKGKLEFDYCGEARPERDVVVMSDLRIVRALLKHFLLDKKQIGPALFELQLMRNLSDRTLVCAGNAVFENSLERATKIGEFEEAFYENLLSRRAMLEETITVKEKCDTLSFRNELLDMFERDRSQAFSTDIGQYLIEKIEQTSLLGVPGEAEAAGSGGVGAGAGRKSVLDTTGGARRARKSTIGGSKGNRGTRLKESMLLGGGGNGPFAGAAQNPTAVATTVADDATLLLKTAYSEFQSNLKVDTDSEEEQEEVKAVPTPTAAMPQAAAPLTRPLTPSKTARKSTSALPIAAITVMADKDDADEEKETEAQQQWKIEMKLLDEATEFTLNCRRRYNEMHQLKTKNAIRMNICYNSNYLKLVQEEDEFLLRFKESLESQTILTIGAKARRIIDLMEEYFSRLWIYCRHLVLIMQCFVQYGFIKQTKYFGTYRVELAVSLFGRIVDLHNFELVLAALSPFEVACLYCRLGWLSVFNPCKPEGTWELDLSRREERVVAKMLCALTIHEPGETWPYQCFRWMRTMDPMPGWELTQSWLTEDGMPMRGLLTVTYYSGEGKNKKGCRPYVSFRKSLLNLVLLNEYEIVKEELRSKPMSSLSGDRAFEKHNNIWESYLGPGPRIESAKAKTQEGKGKSKGKGKGKSSRK